jgi:hypothetical protein
VTNIRSIAPRWATAVACALLWSAGTIPAAYADGETPPVTVVSPSPTPSGETSPGTDPVVVPSPGTDPVVVPSPGTDPVVVPSPGTDPVVVPSPGTDPVVVPSPGTDPVAAPTQTQGFVGAPTLIAPGPAPFGPVITLPSSDTPVVNIEAVPAATEPSPTLNVTPEAETATAPIALPEPVTKSFNAVVATAAGSPLHVQILTVLLLVGAGILYFRFLGTRGTKVPSKSAK